MHSVFRCAAILRCLLPLTALSMVSAGAPLNARTANCDAAAQQQQRARARVGASRGMPVTARNAEQTSTGQLAKRLQRQIEAGALPPSTALLFYTRGADGSLTMCLVNPTGLIASALSKARCSNLSRRFAGPMALKNCSKSVLRGDRPSQYSPLRTSCSHPEWPKPI